MDKKEQIEHWCVIIRCVFQGEHDINDGVIADGKHKGLSWQQVLRDSKNDDKSVRDAIADEYVHAIAERIIENGYMKFEGEQ